jgi:hypothetical protein
MPFADIHRQILTVTTPFDLPNLRPQLQPDLRVKRRSDMSPVLIYLFAIVHITRSV